MPLLYLNGVKTMKIKSEKILHEKQIKGDGYLYNTQTHTPTHINIGKINGIRSSETISFL